MDKDDFIEKRFLDLFRQASNQYRPVFSEFLTLYEISILKRLEKKLSGGYCLFGGYKEAERQMASFLPDAFFMGENRNCEEISFPIRILKFCPRNAKFAENLSHRDVLGAVMGLGFGREKIGDILLEKNEIFIFANTAISDYLLDNLRQIRKTSVKGENTEEFEVPKKKALPMNATVSSNRLDTVVSAMTGEGRGKAQELIKSGLVFVDGFQMTYVDKEVLPGKIISIRGFGKFLFNSADGLTRKGRVKISFNKYI